MQDETNKAIVRRLFEEVLNKRKTVVVDEIVSDNYLLHNPPPGLAKGIKGFKELVMMYHTGFPDLCIDIEDIIGESDKVVVR